MKDRRRIARPAELGAWNEKQKLNSAHKNFRCLYCNGEDSEERSGTSCGYIHSATENTVQSCIDVELLERISEGALNDESDYDDDVRWRRDKKLSPSNSSRNNSLDSKLSVLPVCLSNMNEYMYAVEPPPLNTLKKDKKTYRLSSLNRDVPYVCTKVFDLTLFCHNVALNTFGVWRRHSPEPLLRVQMKECHSSPPSRRKLRSTSSAAPTSRRPFVGWFAIILRLLALMECCAAAAASQCDVYASGLDRTGREVGAEYLRCLAGRLEWKYPRNGLRLLLQSPEDGREFRGCIKADPEFDGARVMVEGKSSLVPLLKTNDHLPLQRERCFSSYQGQVALYLEAAPLPNDQHLSAHTAGFQYDLELLPPGTYYSPDQECRPCSDDELLEAACTSDIVATGRLMSIEMESDTTSTTGTFDDSNNSIDAVTRSTIDSSFLTPSPLSSLGRGPSPIPPSSRSILKFAASRITRELTRGDDAVFQKVRGGGVVASIDVPSHCGMRAGPGTYLLMARMKMGSPKLKCIPKLTDFETLSQKRKSDLQCLLKL